MSLKQIQQVRRLRQMWHYKMTNIFRPSGSPHDGLVLSLMAILNKSEVIAEYGAHTGEQSAFLASISDSVNGKFIGIDDWSYFNSSEEKSKILIKAKMDFLGIRNYEIVTADCNKHLHIEADFHYWDVCRSGTPELLVNSIHELIKFSSKKRFMLCIDDVIREHPYGNKEFLDAWKNRFSEITDADVVLITENKLFLANYKLDDKLNRLLSVLSEEQIIPYKSSDPFYNHTKYIGKFFDAFAVQDWSSKLLTNDLFWSKIEDTFND